MGVPLLCCNSASRALSMASPLALRVVAFSPCSASTLCRADPVGHLSSCCSQEHHGCVSSFPISTPRRLLLANSVVLGSPFAVPYCCREHPIRETHGLHMQPDLLPC
ncbi:hypothetical protein D1007_16924 [Hordeum vulgare]|nr:hypothetical protein D1007_16924 [Hordeum vulgare]